MDAQIDALHLVRTTVSGKFLTFTVGPTTCGVPVRDVKEIIGLPDIAAVPDVPACVAGVIELRGRWVPVIDLRARLDLEKIEYDERTCVVVVDIGTPAGLIVDTVDELVDVVSEHIHDVDPGRTPGGDAAIAIWRHHVEATILLDVSRLLSGIEMGRIMQAAAVRASDAPMQ